MGDARCCVDSCEAPVVVRIWGDAFCDPHAALYRTLIRKSGALAPKEEPVVLLPPDDGSDRFNLGLDG